MSFNVATYDPRNVNLYLAGPEVDNFADGSFIEIQYTSATNTIRSGAKGDATFIKVNDATGSCTIRLKQNSTMHAALVVYQLTDNSTQGGIAALPFLMMQGSTPVAEGVFKIGKLNKRSFEGSSDGKDEPICEWTLVLASLRITS